MYHPLHKFSCSLYSCRHVIKYTDLQVRHLYGNTLHNVYISVRILTDIQTYLLNYLHTNTPTYLDSYIHTYFRTYAHTHLHTFTHLYIHTCSLTYIRTYFCEQTVTILHITGVICTQDYPNLEHL